MSTLREVSQANCWKANEPPNVDQINAGSLQRIADAAEKMAANHDAFVRERDFYKTQCESYRKGNDRLFRRVASLRGVITKMKKRGAA